MVTNKANKKLHTSAGLRVDAINDVKVRISRDLVAITVEEAWTIIGKQKGHRIEVNVAARMIRMITLRCTDIDTFVFRRLKVFLGFGFLEFDIKSDIRRLKIVIRIGASITGKLGSLLKKFRLEEQNRRLVVFKFFPHV